MTVKREYAQSDRCLSRVRLPARRGVLTALLVVLTSGCAKEEHPPLAEYLGELELEVPLESKVYVELGEFDVPLTIRPAAKRRKKPVRMRLLFELSAEVDPTSEAAVLSAYERHRGAMNDAILRIVRHSSADDLADPRLAAIKTRMYEAVSPLLGAAGVRQLVLNDIDTEPM